ncbi:MAG: AAA family ATPase [Alphaproteobacteria bacterium]|nr:AAA family ATPase [Alphaproteobacteria bacterium]
MLTQLTIRNFKGFEDVDIELGDRVVFIGPNNSGKTSALQALALWDLGLKRWIEKRGVGAVPRKRPGVTVSRRDLIAVPVPDANQLWRDSHVRATARKGTQNIRIDIVVKGVTGGKAWECGLEFDYANEESFYCRPLRLTDEAQPERMPVPREADVRVAFLPPMSGLTATELRLDAGAINVRVGEGRTAEVLRNLCHQVLERSGGEEQWERVATRIRDLFGVALEHPKYSVERGEINLAYRNRRGIRLDISASGRGLQQTLLLLAHMTVNPGCVLLLDEPDAHLEILRQRQIYQILTDVAREHGNQMIAASHSEVVLNEAADRDIVVAFVGRPHRIDDRGSQVLKSLKEIGFDHYYQAEEVGWVLYLEGSTDLAILRAFADVLDHPAKSHLERPFVHYVLNQPTKAQSHFHGLREAKADLVGIAVYDRSDRAPPDDSRLRQYMWSQREIENYIARRDVLLAWTRWKAADQNAGPLFERDWVSQMEASIDSLEEALAKLRKPSPWGADIKVTDDFLDPLFVDFFERLKLPNLMRKTDYHDLARFARAEDLDPEIGRVLDAIVDVASTARPRRD